MIKPPIRSFVVATLIALCAAAVLASTQNTLPKYDGSGNLIDSAVSESAGNVGIGTTSPGAKLHLYSATGNPGLMIETGAGHQWYFQSNNSGSSTPNALALYDLTANGSTPRVLFDQAGNVGIGTTSPAANLHIYSAAGNPALQIESGAGHKWYLQSNNAGSGTPNGLAFYDLTASGGTPRVLFDQSGNVGIGTTTPSSKLHVVGDVTVTGNIAAKYQDVAEWVPSRGAAPSGTVMVISEGEGEVNVLAASSRKYDTAVAGVVSEQPGITLGERGQGKVVVAHTGRVHVNVDASYGPIHAGDLLATSDTPGFAMLSRPIDVGGAKFHRPGTIIGKALESLASGKGTILVLLALQ